MKFKKIEISAFRIYNDPKDATFDFSISNGMEVADFISIYAPNGFGKTSFYDAVEWCMTNNIHRFWQNRGITEGAINAQNSFHDGQLKIWQNTESDLPTFVNILNENNETFRRELSTKARSDAKYNKEPERKSFANVILSQEWVSAFLKETNGVMRYKVFMSNPELQNLAEYFKNLKVLINICSRNITILENDISERDKVISSDQNSSLLDQINSVISVLRSAGKIVSSPALDMNESQVLNFKNEISDLKNYLKIDSLSQQILFLQIAKIGNDDIVGIDGYYEYIIERNKLSKQIESTKITLSQFDQLDSLKFERESCDGNRRNALIKLEEISSLKLKLPEYRQIETLISEIMSRLRSLDAERGELRLAQREKELNFRDENEKIELLSKRLEKVKESILNVPVVEQYIQFSYDNLAFYYWGIDQIDSQISELSLINAQFLNREKEYDETVKLPLRNYDFENVNKELIDASKHSILNRLIELRTKSGKFIEALAEVDKNLIEYESMNSVLKELLRKGLDVINEKKLNECPLCSQKYNSYSELINRVANNKLIEEKIVALLSEQALLKLEIEGQRVEIDRDIQSIILEVSQKSQIYTSIIQENNRLISDLKIDYSNLNSLIIETKNIITDNRLKLDNREPSEVIANLNSQIAQLTQIVSTSKTNRDLIGNNLGSIEIELAINQNKKIQAEKEVEELKMDRRFKLVSDWFYFEESQKEVTEQLLNDRITSLEDTLRGLDSNLKSIEDQIFEFSKRLELVSRESLNNKQTTEEKQLGLVNNVIKRYSEFLNLHLKISEIPEGKQEFVAELESKLLKEQENLAHERHSYDQFSKLEAYMENLVPFLRIAKLKEENNIAKKDILLIQGLRTELEEEWGNVKEELNSRLKQFFYLDLINTIYNKIDPHPTFKKVDFYVDLDTEDPTLDIFVIDETPASDKAYVPNLYFSTAQINILSLSIFLASALNSKEYQCIFIDDPIQSLDTINILSTIDLLRSIVINHGRQVVLSTHDESFHKLLARKIPPEFFKSKFIELETFGKVRQTS